MPKTLRIIVKLEAQTAPVKVAAVADLKAVEAQAVASATKVERSAKQQLISVEALAVKGLQLTAKVEKAKERAGAKAATDAERAAKRQADAEAAAQARILRDNERSIDAKLRGIARHDAQWTRAYTKEEAQRRALNEKTRRQNEAMVTSELKAMGITDRRFKNGWEGADKLLGGVVNLAGAFGFVTSASAGIQVVADQFDRMNRSMLEGVELSTDYRENMLELAALKGRMGDSGGEMRESLAFRAKTLQSREAATAFQETALGVGQSAIDDEATGRKGFISPEEFRKAMEFGGSFQAMEKGDARTHGQLVGQIPSLLGRRTDATEVAAMEAKLFGIYQPGGASFSSMVEGYLKNAPAVTSGMISPERLAAVESAMSLFDPGGHAEKTQQFIRATSGGIGKMKGPKMEGEDLEKIGPYLKRLGVTEKMDPIEIGKKVSADLSEQEAKGRNLKTYLAEKGYGNQEEANALLGFHGMVKSGQFKSFEDSAAAPATAANVQARVRGFQGADPVAQARKKDLARELGTLTAGVGAPETYQAVMETTFNRLKDQKSGTGLGTTMTGQWKDIAEAGWFDFGAMVKQDTVFKAALESQYGEMERVGTPELKAKATAGRQKYLRAGSDVPFQAEQQRIISENVQAIGEAGGNILPDFNALVDRADKQLEATNKLVELMRKGQMGPPPPPLPVGVGAGAQGMAR